VAGFDEAAQWCLDNNYNLEEALKWEDTSIQNEDRFENWETKFAHPGPRWAAQTTHRRRFLRH